MPTERRLRNTNLSFAAKDHEAQLERTVGLLGHCPPKDAPNWGASLCCARSLSVRFLPSMAAASPSPTELKTSIEDITETVVWFSASHQKLLEANVVVPADGDEDQLTDKLGGQPAVHGYFASVRDMMASQEGKSLEIDGEFEQQAWNYTVRIRNHVLFTDGSACFSCGTGTVVTFQDFYPDAWMVVTNNHVLPQPGTILRVGDEVKTVQQLEEAVVDFFYEVGSREVISVAVSVDVVFHSPTPSTSDGFVTPAREQAKDLAVGLLIIR